MATPPLANAFANREISAATDYLRAHARKRSIVSYDDVFKVVREFGTYHGPHDPHLWDLLRVISETEIAEGRPALSAIVVVQRGEGANRPGSGFFTLMRTLGRYKSTDDETWLAEIDGLFGYWPQH
jgi:hypothetical protein